MADLLHRSDAVPLPGGDRAGTFGAHTLTELPGVVRRGGWSRVLLLTGKGSFDASGAAAVLPALREVATVETWSDFSPNPRIDDAIEGARIVAAFGPDAIVAIGGGSVLDMAKLLASLGELAPDRITAAARENRVPDRTRGLVLVPTTSGSGSEATHFAVVYIDGEKYSVAAPSLLPDYVVLDPVLTESASGYQKATSVFDALAQAVESHWARGATDLSRQFAQRALTDLADSAPAFVAGSSPAAVRAASGSHLAGRAIDISKTTGAHAMAYGFTSRYGISHGHAVALTLGAFARRHAQAAAAGRGHDLLAEELDSIAELIGADGADSVGDRLDAIAAEIGLELRLESLGVPRADLASMAADVNQERLGNNPLAVDHDGLLELLDSCW